MVITIAALAGLLYSWLDMSLGAAIVIAAALAPTDPVLAGEVQVSDPSDRDRLRSALTGEAGLNDGTAYPFVLLGLGLLSLHDLGPGMWRWWAIDLVWAVAGGVAIGAALGVAVGRWVLHRLRSDVEEASPDAFLGLGLVAIAYRNSRQRLGVRIPRSVRRGRRDAAHGDAPRRPTLARRAARRHRRRPWPNARQRSRRCNNSIRIWSRSANSRW
jgi:hypothetical protein